MRFTPGERGMVWSLRTAVVAQVACDECSGELWNLVVLGQNATAEVLETGGDT